MAELDIAEKRLPQDGRITLRLGGRPVDVRVSTLPTGHGERVVLRLLDKEPGGSSPKARHGADPAALDRLMKQPHGIVLVTGPTGSGKTTTLYASLSRLDAATHQHHHRRGPDRVRTGGHRPDAGQPAIDMTFARALRAILRQDPDVIMIGEIRDLETAQIAVQASLTGHLVLATLHTNDAPCAVTRLLDMGIEPFLLSSSMLGILAQRLLRKLCPECRRQDSGGRWRAVGCPDCGQVGYVGRTGVYELMVANESISALIHNRASEAQLTTAAVAEGMRPMREDGDRLVAHGITSPEELLRVTRET